MSFREYSILITLSILVSPALCGGPSWGVDLDMAGVTEEGDERDPGGYVALNDDDDNDNSTADKDENPVTGEDDLVEIWLKRSGGDPGTGTIRLSLTETGNGRIKVWDNPTKTGTPLITHDDTTESWSPADIPTSGAGKLLYVEGVTTSSAAKDVELTLTWVGAPGADPYDKISITVVDVQLTECDSDWLPKGGEEDNTTTFTATVYPSALQGILRFTLPSEDVSDYPGYCTNAGDESDDEKDLQFPAQSGYTISGTYDSIATKDSAANNATVTVKSFDYGSSGTVIAEAQIGGTWFAANVVGATTKKKATVPKDTDKDGLADKWETDMRTAWQAQYGQAPNPNTSAFFDKTSDKEAKDPDGAGNIPAHATTGDGLSALKEYRGYKAIDPTNPTKVVRLSPVRKELLVEVDVMAPTTTAPPNGGTATTISGSPQSMVRDTTKNWTNDALIGLKVNPDTTQSRLFPILDNDNDAVFVPGYLDEATAAATPQYTFSKHIPPTIAQTKTIMGYVQNAFDTAGVKTYYVVDDTSGSRVPWSHFENDAQVQTWMNDSRDTGQAGEQDYRDFVHLSFVDIRRKNLTSLGWSGESLNGGCVCVSEARELAKNYPGIQGLDWMKITASLAAHELGHSVKCDHPEAGDARYEDAFKIKYTSTAAAANLTAPGGIVYGHGRIHI